MTRPFGKLFLLRSGHLRLWSCLSLNHRVPGLVLPSVNVRLLISSPGGHLLQKGPAARSPQTFSKREKGRSFEAFSLPSMIQKIWRKWQTLEAEDMTMEVLHTGYLVSFHNLPPVSQDPVGFPSYGLRSTKAQALQAEVGKVLEEGALHVVDLPGPG